MPKTYKVNADTLNIREGPGTDYEVVGEVEEGAVVTVPDADGWLPILVKDVDDDGDSSKGVRWVSAKYLQEYMAPPMPKPKPEPEPKPTPEPKPEPGPSGPHLMQSQLMDEFGYPQDPAPYLTTFSLKEFANDFSHVKDYEGNPWSFRVYGHQLMVAPLKQAFQNLLDRGFAGELRTYDGCVSIRKMKGGSSMSIHSWGLAVDFNAGSNPFGGQPTFSEGFVKCFADAGMEWGGLWSTPDGMHFQWPWTRIRTDGNPLNPKDGIQA